MSKNDYTKFSNPRKMEQKPVENQNGVTKVEEPVEPKVETPEVPEPIVGVVVNCKKLNVREEPHIEADVLCVIEAGCEVTVDIFETTEEFYKVCTEAGVEGFCMKKYIEVE